MPIYSYHCSACDVRFDKLIRNGSSRVACPECAGTKVERTMSLPARPAGAGASATPDVSRLGPPAGGGCCGGGCHSHAH
jgi:putative FmdB family regulatory protein